MTGTDGQTFSSPMITKEISCSRNRHGEGFDEVGVESFVAYTDDGVPVSSMGVDFRDWDKPQTKRFRNGAWWRNVSFFRNEDGNFSRWLPMSPGSDLQPSG